MQFGIERMKGSVDGDCNAKCLMAAATELCQRQACSVGPFETLADNIRSAINRWRSPTVQVLYLVMQLLLRAESEWPEQVVEAPGGAPTV